MAKLIKNIPATGPAQTVLIEAQTKDETTDGRGNSGGNECGKTMFEFMDTAIAIGVTSSNKIADKTTCQRTACNSEDGSNIGRTGNAKTEEIRRLREED